MSVVLFLDYDDGDWLMLNGLMNSNAPRNALNPLHAFMYVILVKALVGRS